ncbi:MAG: 4,5-DOPA dioxygenase extradiol [Sphingomonadales bacterium]|nr:4,5-DOPA dioxygenase extradiol [Sphingomonadales bacterium]MBU3993330.1 4,5-DOPA dioxygenase extradiol [Alphaproteobacteria bacterium]
MKRLPTLFVGHGSPMTVITDSPERRALVALGKALPRPDAILCISAHWETRGHTHVTAAEHPRTIHDFRGFPPELYAIEYRAPGSAGLVERTAALIGEEHIVRDTGWGFDHGTWGVLEVLFPGENIPTVAMSLDRALGPDGHRALGAMLAPLRDEGVLIVGSGNVVHNLALYRQSVGTVPEWAEAFRTRINRAVTDNDARALTTFAADDQSAAAAINSAEHYLPLLYAVGARLPGDAVGVFNDTVDGALSMTSYLIGDTAPLAALQ